MKVPPVSENLDRAAAWTWRVLVCASALAVLLALVWYVRVIALPIAVALTIAPALSPVASWFRGRRHLERAAAGLALLTGLAVVALLISIVAVSVVQQFDELVDSVARAVDDLVAAIESEPFNLTLADDFQSTLEDSWRQASGYAASRVQAGAGIVTGVALAVAMLYFVLRDGGDLWASILRRFPFETRPAVDRAGRRAWGALGGFVRATAQVATVDALLIGVGLWLLGVPLAFALAVLVFMGSFVPYVGSLASGLVAVLVGFADGGWELALAVLAPGRRRPVPRGHVPPADDPEPQRPPAPGGRAARRDGGRLALRDRRSVSGRAGGRSRRRRPRVAVRRGAGLPHRTVVSAAIGVVVRLAADVRRAAVGWQHPRPRSEGSHETKETP